jgi:Transposase IS4
LISTELPHFEANRVQTRPGHTPYTNLSEIGFFELFFSDTVVQILSEETNLYAEFKRQTNPLPIQEQCYWVPTTIEEIRVYLDIHLYFGLYHLAVRADYWRIHKLGQFMGYGRFKRIHRYFSLNDENATPPPPNSPWFHRIQRVSDLIRTACRNSYTPSSYIAIDEAMVAFKGRSKHTVKLKNKPISNGYKLWCIRDHGYIWSWLFHSRVDGVEGFTKSQPTYWPQKSMNAAGEPLEKRASLAPTYALVLRLATQLPKLEFCIYLDNLFLNLPVAQCLLSMGIYCTGTTRKKAIGFPSSLQSYLENNNELLWDSTIAQVVDNNALCFIWQDNKPMAAISTAYSLHRPEDQIQRLRRCPKINAENQRILRPVFQGQPFKELFIPKAIDDYNHHMKGVDQADQLRAGFTCHRKQNYRTQMPLFYFLLDVSCVNAFLLWQRSSAANAAAALKIHNSHRAFMTIVCDKLLRSNPKIKDKQEEEGYTQSVSIMALSRHHTRVQDGSSGRCQWGKLHPPGCPRKRAAKRKFGDDITANAANGANEAILGGSRGHSKCSKCQIWLCVEGPC